MDDHRGKKSKKQKKETRDPKDSLNPPDETIDQVNVNAKDEIQISKRPIGTAFARQSNSIAKTQIGSDRRSQKRKSSQADIKTSHKDRASVRANRVGNMGDLPGRTPEMRADIELAKEEEPDWTQLPQPEETDPSYLEWLQANFNALQRRQTTLELTEKR